MDAAGRRLSPSSGMFGAWRFIFIGLTSATGGVDLGLGGGVEVGVLLGWRAGATARASDD